MRRYIYRARGRTGKTQKGEVMANNSKDAKKLIEKRGLAVKSIGLDLKYFFEEAMARSGRVSNLDRVLFTKHLSVMIRAGLTLDESLKILQEQSSSTAMKRVSRLLIMHVESGNQLSDGMARFPRIFSDLYVNVVRSGEKSGNLEKNLDQLALQMTKAYELSAKIKSAMAYPILVLVASVVVGLSVATFVLPKITRLFKSFDVELPFLTRVLITVSDLFGRYGLVLSILIVVAIVLLIWFLRSRIARPFVHRLILKIPIVGRIAQNTNLALSCRTLGTSLSSGLPIVQALAVTSKTFSNVVYRGSLDRVQEQVRAGQSLSSALAANPLYPPVVYRMIAVGERTGKMDEVLHFLAEFYENEVDIATKNLSTVIEPLLLVFIGLFVAALALAIITPIYQITGSIGNTGGR